MGASVTLDSKMIDTKTLSFSLLRHYIKKKKKNYSNKLSYIQTRSYTASSLIADVTPSHHNILYIKWLVGRGREVYTVYYSDEGVKNTGKKSLHKVNYKIHTCIIWCSGPVFF
jgi:hypothetical protein